MSAKLSERLLRLGVVGCGRIAQVAHLPAIEKSDDVELVCVCDASSELASGVGRRYRVETFTEVDRMLDSDIDAVLVATPDRLHVAHATAALEADKHVLVEKPLAPAARDARILGELAEARGRKLQVGAMKRHDPGLQFARDAVSEIGPILSVTCWYRVMAALRPPTEATLFPRVVVDSGVRAQEATYKADREKYLLMTHGVHVFDGLRYLAGDLVGISALVANVGADFVWHGRGELTSDGGIASFEIAANAHRDWSEGFEIHGGRGTISIRSAFPFYRRASEVRLFLEDTGTDTTPHFGDADPYQRQLESFARAIADDAPTNPGAFDGAAAVAMVEATAESSRRAGATIEL